MSVGAINVEYSWDSTLPEHVDMRIPEHSDADMRRRRVSNVTRSDTYIGMTVDENFLLLSLKTMSLFLT